MYESPTVRKGDLIEVQRLPGYYETWKGVVLAARGNPFRVYPEGRPISLSSIVLVHKNYSGQRFTILKKGAGKGVAEAFDKLYRGIR